MTIRSTSARRYTRRREQQMIAKTVDALNGTETIAYTPAERLVANAKMQKQWAEKALIDESMSLLRAVESYGQSMMDNAIAARTRFQEIESNASVAVYDATFWSTIHALKSYAESLGRRAADVEKELDKFRTTTQPLTMILAELDPKPAEKGE